MKTILLSIAHLRSISEGIFNFFATIIASVFGYYNVIVATNTPLFAAVTIVVVADWIFGILRILIRKNEEFETRKALKIIYYLFAYNTIVFVILAIEKAQPSAFFLDETIVLPIILFQLISMLKNISLLGWIPQGLLLQILSNIDNYKEKTKNSITQQTTESIQIENITNEQNI